MKYVGHKQRKHFCSFTRRINCHEADLVFGRGLTYKINNFDEA